MSALKQRLTYANVMATMAVFIALSGSSYAALKVTGKDVRNSSLTYRDLKRNTLGGTRIKESRLGVVPRARNSARLGGLSAARLLVRCPADTVPVGGTCVETTSRSPAPYGAAVYRCRDVDEQETPGRRLPTHGEMLAAFTKEEIQLAPGGEFTSDIYPRSDGRVDALYLTSETGRVGVVADDGNTPKAFRCVADPLN